MKIDKVLVTGGAGFIGSEFTRLLVKKGYKPVVVDKLTYAGDLERLKTVKGNYIFYKADITDKKQIEAIFAKEKPKAVVNFAAETHVDRSINDSSVFIKTNVTGTQVLLDLSRKFKIQRFIHISTDEVYGDILKGSFKENCPFGPSSPYAASKAAADLLVKAYIRTYQFPALVIRPSNNYGPWQYPEKLIPLSILRVLKDEKIPLYADGKNIREWLYVGDCAEAIFSVMINGKTGQVYNLGSNYESSNIDVAGMILHFLGASLLMIKFVKDRPGHDKRYKLNSGKINRELHWKPKVSFKEGLKATVEWSLLHKDWLFGKYKEINSLYG